MATSNASSSRKSKASVKDQVKEKIVYKYPATSYRFISSDLKLLESGNLSDVKVICGDRSWKLHQFILTSRCSWFEKALNGSFLESQTRVINIEGFSPDLIDTMIHYIYSGGDLEIAKVEQAKDESLLSCYVKAWSAADFFLLESMKQDCVDGLKKSCEQDINVTTDLKAKLPLSKQRPILKKLADGVATAYHHHPHAEPCQSVLVNFAFASRLFFMGMDNFRNLIEQERDFGHGFYVKLMRSRDFQYFGRLDPTSLTTFVDNQCRSCQRVYAYAGGCFHIFDDKKGTSKSDPVIRWKCGLCKQRDKQANVVRIELCEQ